LDIKVKKIIVLYKSLKQDLSESSPF